MERTFVMLKPDALNRGLAGNIISKIEAKGYRIVASKIINMDKEILREHYSHIVDKPFYHDLETFMMSGPVWGWD